MHSEKLKQLLDDLRKEVTGKPINNDVQQPINDLDIDINQLLMSEPDMPEQELLEEVIEQARDVEAKFAVEHPVAERLMQEIIYMLGRMGI